MKVILKSVQRPGVIKVILYRMGLLFAKFYNESNDAPVIPNTIPIHYGKSVFNLNLIHEASLVIHPEIEFVCLERDSLIYIEVVYSENDNLLVNFQDDSIEFTIFKSNKSSYGKHQSAYPLVNSIKNIKLAVRYEGYVPPLAKPELDTRYIKYPELIE